MQTVALDSVDFVGSGLQRPECVLSTANGRLYVSDWRGGISVIEPNGEQWQLLASTDDFEVLPNGICLLPDGGVLLAHLGAEDGGVFHLDESASLRPWLTEVDGVELPPTNFVHLDGNGRVWVTVSTRLQPRALGYRADCDDGFIVLQDQRGARIVADGLGYTNECIVHPDGRRLFVNETFARRLACFDITDDGALVNKRVITEFGTGVFPDGLTFDENGDVWITSVVSNRVVHIDSAGRQTVVLEDCEPDHLDWVEAAYQAGKMGRPHLDGVRSHRLRNISSMAFGGPDLSIGYLGCLLGDAVARFKTPVNGHPPPHWHFAGPQRARDTNG
jgi:sugar lactone lactonase YvrE